MKNQRRHAFTLIETLIVIAIIAILGAIIFPSFRSARENARQKTCVSNLHEIGLAVQQYRADEKEFPSSLAALLPSSFVSSSQSSSAHLDNTATPPTVFIDEVVNGACNTTTNTCPNPRGTGYLKSTTYLLCPDDHSSSTQPRSSYGDLSTFLPPRAATAGATPAPLVRDDDTASNYKLHRYLWNFWGYRSDGTAYASADEAASYRDIARENSIPAQPPASSTAPIPVVNPWLVDPTQPYYPSTSRRINYVKNSLSNRFAPASTIVTYCPYHRVHSSSVSSPEKLYDPAEATNAVGARDLILRLDGTVKSVVVSSWNTTDPNHAEFQMWQKQNFR